MTIRKMTPADTAAVLEMMGAFYGSEAVLSNGSEEIFRADIAQCVSGSPYLEGYVFEADGQPGGYAMLAKSWVAEFGKPCVWIEDLYLKEEFRNRGVGSRFLSFVREAYPHAALRLEVEAENTGAMHVYEKAGFQPLPYLEMIQI